MRFRCLIFLLFFAASSAFSQDSVLISSYTDRINSIFLRIKADTIEETLRQRNDSILFLVREIAEQDGSFHWELDSLRFMKKFVADDRQMALYSWVVPMGESRRLYNAVFQTAEGETYTLRQTADTSYIPKNQLYAKDWYGALYYEIIPFKSEKRTLYALIGWRELADRQQKVVDILDISSGELLLGQPLFLHTEEDFYGKEHTISQHRLIFEYDKRVTMFLSYNKRKKRLELDNLSPMEVVDGKVLSYGPDFSVNAYRLRKGRWVFVEDIKVKNRAR